MVKQGKCIKSPYFLSLILMYTLIHKAHVIHCAFLEFLSRSICTFLERSSSSGQSTTLKLQATGPMLRDITSSSSAIIPLYIVTQKKKSANTFYNLFGAATYRACLCEMLLRSSYYIFI